MIFILHAHNTTNHMHHKFCLYIIKAIFVIHQQWRAQTHALKHNNLYPLTSVGVGLHTLAFFNN